MALPTKIIPTKSSRRYRTLEEDGEPLEPTDLTRKAVLPVRAPELGETIKRPTERIPNKAPAPKGVDKWQHNNALALGVLTGKESEEERKEKIAAYLKAAGVEGTDEKAFTAQLHKDAIALQEKMKAAGLPVGTIDGRLGDISMAAVEKGKEKFAAMLGDKAKEGPIDLLSIARMKPGEEPKVVATKDVIPTDPDTSIIPKVEKREPDTAIIPKVEKREPDTAIIPKVVAPPKARQQFTV